MRDKKKINIEANKTFGDFITVGDLHLARGKGVKGTISNHPSVYCLLCCCSPSCILYWHYLIIIHITRYVLLA